MLEIEKQVTEKKRGRPPKGDKAQTSTERARKSRDKAKKEGRVFCQFELDKYLIEIIDEYRQITGASSRTEVIRDILNTWVCDTTEALPKLRQQFERMKQERGG